MFYLPKLFGTDDGCFFMVTALGSLRGEEEFGFFEARRRGEARITEQDWTAIFTGDTG